MTIGFILWCGSLLFGSAMLLAIAKVDSFWQRRAIFAEATMAIFFVNVVFGVVSGLPLPVTILITLVALWLGLLAGRLRFGRLDLLFLRQSTVGNVLMGLGCMIAIFGATILLQAVPLAYLFMAVTAISIVVATVFLCQIIWTARRFTLPKPSFSLKQLPTVSVCIPARNEDNDLAECIAAVLRSDYPKLEIIVLDDCSQDKTADVIKSFAHSGVRFVQGDVPASGWLGKNQAMQTMAQHASGDYVVFMSVDTLVGKNTITKLVHYALAKKMQMVSVLPQDHTPVGLNALFGTLQYFWQIALPITSRRVPVSGKLWLIGSKTLKDLGGFESVKHKIVPEGSFARRLFTKNAYRFFVSDQQLDVSTSKSRASQIKTSMRLLYPTCKRQPMFVLAVSVVLVSLLLLPFFMSIVWLANEVWVLFACNSVAAILLWVSYLLVLRRTHPASWVIGFVMFPIVLVQEIIMLVGSMLAYEFTEVNWKGRNVCYPVISLGRTSRPLRAESLR